MTKFTTAALGVLLALGIPGASAHAKPKVSTSTQYYTLTGKTVPELRAELKKKGPRGYWAYTEWYVRWSGSCALSVDIKYTLPKHKSPGALDPRTRASLDSMIAALTRHEQGHGAFAINAASEIEKTRCADGDAVLAKYLKAEKAYDKKTDHGKREGVVLK